MKEKYTKTELFEKMPVGKALLGHAVKDKVEIDLGGEKIAYKIVSIEKQ